MLKKYEELAEAQKVAAREEFPEDYAERRFWMSDVEPYTIYVSSITIYG